MSEWKEIAEIMDHLHKRVISLKENVETIEYRAIYSLAEDIRALSHAIDAHLGRKNN